MWRKQKNSQNHFHVLSKKNSNICSKRHPLWIRCYTFIFHLCPSFVWYESECVRSWRAMAHLWMCVRLGIFHCLQCTIYPFMRSAFHTFKSSATIVIQRTEKEWMEWLLQHIDQHVKWCSDWMFICFMKTQLSTIFISFCCCSSVPLTELCYSHRNCYYFSE